MSMGKTIGAILGGFVLVSATSYLIHQVILQPDYMASASSWRDPEDIAHRMWAIASRESDLRDRRGDYLFPRSGK